MIQSWHVYPVNDRLPHNTENNACMCNPTIEVQPNGNKVVTHNSWDGREYKEKDSTKKVS